MGFLSGLFGGPKRINTLTGGQNELLGNLTSTLNREWGRSGDVYGGQRIAGLNPMMQSAFSGMSQAAQMDPNLQGAVSSALGGAGDMAGVSNLYQSALAPAREEFRRTLQDVGARYGDTWGQSGALPEMVGRATADYGMGLTNLLGNLTYNDRQGALNRQAQAIPAALGVEAQQNRNLQDLFGMGQEARAVEQQQLLGDMSAWDERQWYNNPALQFLTPALGTQAYGIAQQQGLLGGLANLGMGAGKAIGAYKAGGGLMGMFGG